MSVFSGWRVLSGFGASMVRFNKARRSRVTDVDSVEGRRGRSLGCKSLNEDESCVCVHHWVGSVVLPGER